MSGTYALRAEHIPLDDSFDVIVAGGGPAGCAAAVAAARAGAKTLLIERGGFLGGAGTAMLVPTWCTFSDKEKQICGGIAASVFAEAKRGMAHVAPAALEWVPIDAERLKRVYDRLVTDAGVTVLFHTLLARVETDGRGGVEAVLTANKAGLCAWKAKVYVDGTGDADLAAWAGAPFAKGDPDDGSLMLTTLCFQITNVDEYGFNTGPTMWSGNPNCPIHAVAKSGRYPAIWTPYFGCTWVGPRTLGFNAGHVRGVDGTSPADVSRGLVEGREMAAQYRDALAEVHPRAFANAHLAATAGQLGIRETRRIVGDYVLTVDDYLARRSFPDDICRNAYEIDLHWSKEQLAAHPEVAARLAAGEFHYKPGESHGIPYRCLLPKGVRNVLVAGRSVSCERVVQGAIRTMATCLCMGEAAGHAAAMAAGAEEPDVHRVDAQDLRRRLRDAGAYLP